MEWRRGRRVRGAAFNRCPSAVLLAAACALTLAACQFEGQPNLAATQPRGATVAFDSIDGLPPTQFQTLVRDLNDEAQTRRLAVISRENPSAYRVRGYFSADIVKDKTTVSWVWDVFDRAEHRALRITGSQVASRGAQEGWPAVDEATMRKVAQSSMDQLATFLTSPDVAPGAAPPQLALAAAPAASSPEAAGIFRIFRAHADPIPAARPPAESEPAALVTPASATVPLPRRRPVPAAAVSARETLTLTARATR